MGTYVVVAIPTNTDYVWKLSSEKVPHLTIMMLNDNMKNVSRVADYIQHTVNTTMKRFGLSVDHRDKLGSEEADVLFFNTDYCMRDLEAFRSNLLKDPDIFIAYNSIPQYPIWSPHLTLGYPSSPA